MLDLAHKVSAHISSLGEDTSTNTHKHCEQGCSETETFQNFGRFAFVNEHYEGSTEQAKTNGEHAGNATRAECNFHCLLFGAVFSGGGDANVSADCEPHTHVAGNAREHCADKEEDTSTDSLTVCICRQQEQHKENNDCKNGQGPKLTTQEGGCAFLNCPSDFLHTLGSLVSAEYLAYQNGCDKQCCDGNGGNDNHNCLVASLQRHVCKLDH